MAVLQLKPPRATEHVPGVIPSRGIEVDVERVPNGGKGVAGAAVIRGKGRPQELFSLEPGLALDERPAVRQHLASIHDVFPGVLPVFPLGEWVGIVVDLHEATPEATVVGRKRPRPGSPRAPLDEVTRARRALWLEDEAPV